MWTKKHRARAAARTKQVKRYRSDLTNEEWQVTEPLMRQACRTGRRRSMDLREAVNAIRYLLRSSCE